MLNKPVWRLNTGVEPEDKTGEVFFIGDTYTCNSNDWLWGIYGAGGDIYAYETNRTRKAKYRV